MISDTSGLPSTSSPQDTSAPLLFPGHKIPDEVLLKIASFLPPSDLSHLQAVNRTWCQLLQDNILWKSLFQQHFPKTYASIELQCKPEETGQAGWWKNQYAKVTNALKNMAAGIVSIKDVAPAMPIGQVRVMRRYGDSLSGLISSSKLFKQPLTTGEIAKEISWPHMFHTVKIQPNKILVARLNSHVIDVWDGNNISQLLRDGEVPSETPSETIQPENTTIRFKVKGKYAIRAQSNGELDIWDHSTRTHLKTLHHPYPGIASVQIAHQKLYVGSTCGRLTIWDMATGEQLHTSKPCHSSIESIKATDKHVALLSNNGTLLIYDKDHIIKQTSPPFRYRKIAQFKLTDNTVTFARKDYQKKIFIDQLANLRNKMARTRLDACLPNGTCSEIEKLKVTEKLVIAGNATGSVFCWDAKSGKRLFLDSRSTGYVADLQFNEGALIVDRKQSPVTLYDFNTPTSIPESGSSSSGSSSSQHT